MTGRPDVSICVATFGDLAYWRPWIDQAVASAEDQTIPVEVVPFHLPESDPRLLGRARNRAAELATGHEIAFLDADDSLGRGYAEALLGAAGDVRVPAVSTQRIDGTWTRAYRLGRAKRMTEAAWPVIGSMMHRADFLRLGGFREDLEWGEDLEWWIWCERSGLSFTQVDEAVYQVGYREGSRKSLRYRGPIRNRILAEARGPLRVNPH